MDIHMHLMKWIKMKFKKNILDKFWVQAIASSLD